MLNASALPAPKIADISFIALQHARAAARRSRRLRLVRWEDGLSLNAHQASTAGKSLLHCCRSAAAWPVKAIPSRRPSAARYSARTPPSIGVISHCPTAPRGGGDTTTGHAGVLTTTGMAG